MNPLLQTHFETALDHPNGIKKLRELILSLAMQGKLVVQDKNDQPARELLTEIQVEKERLVKEGKIKKTDALPPIKEEEKPFVLPEGWEWVRLGEVTNIIMGQSPDSKTYNDLKVGLPFYQGKSEFGMLNPTPRVWCSAPIKIAPPNSILISVRAPIGPTNINLEESCIGRGLASIVSLCECSLFYYLYFLKCFETRLASLGTGSTFQAITQKVLFNFPLPLPPLAEQKRIVEKVDQLFLLCDELERLQQSRNSKRKELHNSVLTQCIEANSVSSFQTSFQFLTTHFHELYSVKENVKELRKAVLQLAVMGKLVPQDKNDQPARELLKEIQAEKERLVKEGKIRKMDAFPPIKDEEKPFVLPEGWEWVRIRDVRYDWGQKVPNKKFTYIDVGSILNLEGKLGDELNVLTPEVAPSRARKIVKKNTVIYSTVRPYLLNIAIIDRDFEYEAIASTAFAILHPHSVIVSKFIFYYLRSPSFIQFVESLMKGVAYPAINDGDFYSALFPLPPLEEQKRIVEKVDELLALCDRLEEEIEKAEAKRGEILEGMTRL